MATEFIRPLIEDVTGQIGNFSQLRADSEQQQQQQQQQAARSVKRFLNLETSNPEEEIVTKLVTEIKTQNRLAPRGK